MSLVCPFPAKAVTGNIRMDSAGNERHDAVMPNENGRTVPDFTRSDVLRFPGRTVVVSPDDPAAFAQALTAAARPPMAGAAAGQA